MRQFLQTIVLLLLFAGNANAQLATPFWTENFTDGMPAGWTTTDASNQNVLWTWCANPILGDGDPGCSQPWDDALNGQQPFRATTANTGFMVLDSDDPGDLPTNHKSQLTTTPINCAGKGQVYITFQTHIGVYTEDAEGNAILRVSSDGNNWTDFTVFPGLTTAERWSENPETPIIDISSVAANQAQVWIQWQWVGNYEYMWSVDDIEVYDQDPTPLSDLGISAFFYPASSFSTPASQIATDTFGFEINLSNNGLSPQTNIKVTVSVKEDGGAELHTQTVTVPELAPGVEDSSIVFPLRFAPELAGGLYSISYTVTADSVDQRPIDNEKSSPFVVSNDVFTKDDGAEQGYRPSAGGDWAVANYYRMSNGNFDKYKATYAEFAFTTNAGDIAMSDVEATVYLLKIHDDVAEDFSDFDNSAFGSSSLDFAGIATFESPDTAQGYDVQRILLTDFNAGTDGVLLETGGRYLLAVEYTGPSAKVFHAFNDDVFFYFPSTFTFSGDWNPNGFGGDVNALLRMYISLLSTTDEQILPENTLRIAPNPIGSMLQLQVDFVESTDATVTIADLNGRVLHIQDHQGLGQQTLQYQLPSLAAGTYLARIATKDGTLTKKFVKM